MLAILFPQINPVMFEIGPISVRWYGFAYAISIVLCLYLMQVLFTYRTKKFSSQIQFNSKVIDSLAIYIILGMILGGRLGFVIFYRTEWFITRPLMVLNTLEGGMSFHGAIIGMAISLLIFCKKHNVDFLSLTDLICTVAPIGLFFGRCANFINAELYGRVTNVEWGVIFPNAGPFARHPSQLYEAATEGILLLILMLILFLRTNLCRKPGALTGVFLIGYAVARIVTEEYREPDFHIGYILNVTTGQALSIPMLIIGMIFILYAFKRRNMKLS